MALSAASLSDPLRVVDSLFAEHCRKAEASQAGPGTAPPAQPQIDQDWGVAAHFEALLSSNAQSVPSLTKRALRAGELTPGMLVRYRGMIQDAFDPEYFQAESHCIEEATGKSRSNNGGVVWVETPPRGVGQPPRAVEVVGGSVRID